MGLSDIDQKSVSHFSMGMKQRLAIARAILTRPELLILDEPINALDPEGIRDMRRLFVRLNREWGTTIFISSHLLSEVEHIADRIGVIAGGRLLKEISMEEIHAYRAEYVELLVDDVAQAARLLERDGRFRSFPWRMKEPSGFMKQAKRPKVAECRKRQKRSWPDYW